VKTRASAKADATSTAKSLIDYSVKTSAVDMELARMQAELARKLMLRFNVRLGYSFKRFICRGCKKLIVPGINARVRLGHGKPAAVRITCLECGRTSRKILKRA
jgi:ribonuclease P protein subunit RPR2